MNPDPLIEASDHGIEGAVSIDTPVDPENWELYRRVRDEHLSVTDAEWSYYNRMFNDMIYKRGQWAPKAQCPEHPLNHE